MHQGRGGRCSPAQIGRLPWAADPVQALANSSTSRVASILCWTLEVMKHLLCGLPVLSLLNVHRFWCNRRLGSTPARRKGCPPCARSSAPVLSPSTYRACIRTIDCRSPSLLMVCRHCCMHAATQHVVGENGACVTAETQELPQRPITQRHHNGTHNQCFAACVTLDDHKQCLWQQHRVCGTQGGVNGAP